MSICVLPYRYIDIGTKTLPENYPSEILPEEPGSNDHRENMDSSVNSIELD